jgi:uncharacterized protein (TIGR00661 family)
MVKILYSVNGDGFGHATRSTPIIQALSKKYKLKVIASSKGSGDFLQKNVGKSVKVLSYNGIRFVYKKNSMDVYNTFTRNAKVILSRSSNLRIIYKTIKSYKPDVIITDCDFPTIVVAKLFKIPLLCVCNIHALSEMKYDVPKKYKKMKYAQRAVVKALSGNIDYHVITTFFYLPVKKKNVFLYPPILRKEILAMNPTRKDYYLVYQTSSTNNNLIKILKSVNARFIVYGFNKEEIDGNVTFRKTNNDQFFKDFKDCRACIANGGFSFISEAVSLHKPVLSIPIRGIVEQLLNALEIKRLGYGDMCDKINRKILLHFIENNDKYYQNLKKHKKENNAKVIRKIEALVREVNK